MIEVNYQGETYDLAETINHMEPKEVRELKRLHQITRTSNYSPITGYLECMKFPDELKALSEKTAHLSGNCTLEFPFSIEEKYVKLTMFLYLGRCSSVLRRAVRYLYIPLDTLSDLVYGGSQPLTETLSQYDGVVLNLGKRENSYKREANSEAVGTLLDTVVTLNKFVVLHSFGVNFSGILKSQLENDLSWIKWRFSIDRAMRDIGGNIPTDKKSLVL